jgi:hypothetical protein
MIVKLRENLASFSGETDSLSTTFLLVVDVGISQTPVQEYGRGLIRHV